MRLQRLGRVCFPIIFGTILSGCSFIGQTLSPNDYSGSSQTWNSILGADNDHFKCPFYQGVTKESVGQDSYPWQQVNLTKTIDVYYYQKDNRQKTNKNVIRYFKYANEVPIPAYKVDEGIESHIDNKFRGFPLASNEITNTMLIPLVDSNVDAATGMRQPLTEVFNPDSRWGAQSEAEIYTMNESKYFGFKLQEFKPENNISTDNYPGVIYVLYKPDRYALYPPEMRTTERAEYKTSKPLYFDVYYSVAKYNKFFAKSCDKPDTGGLTPPWEFGVCRYTKNGTTPTNSSAATVPAAPSAGTVNTGEKIPDIAVTPRLHRTTTTKCVSGLSHIAPPADTEGPSANERSLESQDIALDTIFSWYVAPNVYEDAITKPEITQKSVNDRTKLGLLYESIWPLNGISGLISGGGASGVNFTAPGFNINEFTGELNLKLKNDADPIELYNLKAITRNLDPSDQCDCFAQYPRADQVTERLQCAFNHSIYKVTFGDIKRASNREIISAGGTFGERDKGGGGSGRTLASLLGELKIEVGRIGIGGIKNPPDPFVNPAIASDPTNKTPIVRGYESAHPLVDYKNAILDWPWCWFTPE
ncbi:MAG TPA: hypothetical protein VJL27_03000 [Patescibacteria group bacterium]|nr:hypothetical protein [Patescibacteria group bacterium]